MSERLGLQQIAELLKSDELDVRRLFEAGRLHGVREGESWTTTRELLEGDLDVLTESGRIDRFRAGIVPETVRPGDPFEWLTAEWVDAALERVRAE